MLNGNVTTDKGKMFVMDKAWLNLTSLLNPIEFSEDASSLTYQPLRGYSTRYQGNDGLKQGSMAPPQ